MFCNKIYKIILGGIKYLGCKPSIELDPISVQLNNIAAYIINALAGMVWGLNLNALFGLFYVESPYFLPFQFITHMFMHGDIWHIFFNMFALWMFGRIMEQTWGWKKFLIFYFVCGFGGALIQEMGQLIGLINSQDYIIGASGAIMGLVGFIVVWIIKNRKTFVRNRNVIIRLVFLALLILYASFWQSGANTAAHLGGFLTGAVLGVINIVLLKNDKYMEGLA